MFRWMFNTSVSYHVIQQLFHIWFHLLCIFPCILLLNKQFESWVLSPEIISTSAVIPTVFTTHQVSSSFGRNAAIDKNNLSVIISYICQWENISGMRAWMAYQCFVMLFNGSISCCWWLGAIWQQELLLLWHPVYHITWSTLVQVIVCYMLSTKPLSESML